MALKKATAIALMLLLSVVLVFALDFNPRGDIVGRSLYNIYDFNYVNATKIYESGSEVCTLGNGICATGGVDLSTFMQYWLLASGNTTGTGTVNNDSVVNFTGGTAINVTRSSNVITINHIDTSTQSSVTNSNGNVIRSLTLDTLGHLTDITSYDLDNRYYTESEITAFGYCTSSNGLCNQTAGSGLSISTDTISLNTSYIGQYVLWNTAYSWGDHSTQNYLDLDTYPNTDTDDTDDVTNGTGAWSLSLHSTSTFNGDTICTPSNGLCNQTAGSGDLTDVYAGTGISVADGDGPAPNVSVTLSFRLPQTCADGEIAEYNDTLGGWSCGVDNSAASGMSNWVVAADDTAGSDTVEDGQTVTFLGGDSYINVTRPATRNINVSLNYAAITALISSLDTNTYNTSEEIQDSVGAMVANGYGVNLSYNDGANALEASFDCSDVASTGMTCSGENILLNSSFANRYWAWDNKTQFVGVLTDEYFCSYETTGNGVACDTQGSGSGNVVRGTTPTIATPLLTLSTTTSTTSGRIFYDATNDRIGVGDGTNIDWYLTNGTMTNTYLCTYSSSADGYVCNTNPSSFESSSSNDIDPDRLNGDSTDNNLVDANIVQDVFVNSSGDSMSGALNMSAQNVTYVYCLTFSNGGSICGS